MIFMIMTKLCNSLKTNYFWYLSVCMFVIQIIHPLRHWIKNYPVRVAFCGHQVFFIACHLVGIGKHFVHTPMLHVKHCFHLLIGKCRSDGNSPIAEFQKHYFCIIVTAIYPRISKACIHFM